MITIGNPKGISDRKKVIPEGRSEMQDEKKIKEGGRHMAKSKQTLIV